MAIAFDSASATASTCSVSTKTVTHTCSGTDRVLFAQVANHSAHGTISGVTYNSVALTKLLEHNDGNTIVGLWYLVAPDTGSSFNLTVTCTVGTGCLCIGGLSFTGASQTGIPDASVSGAVGTTTSFTQTVTSVADNCFAVWSFKAGGGFALTGGTNTTVGSQPEAVSHGLASGYSTASKTPAGSFALNMTSSSQVFTGILASFAPSGASFTPSPDNRMYFM